MSRQKIFGLVVLGCLLLSGSPILAETCYLVLSCAPDKPFHPVQCDASTCKDSSGSDAIPRVTMFVENHGWDVYPSNRFPKILMPVDFHRAWLEFNDAGHAFDAQQKMAILQKIEELKKSERPLLVVIFVHGWHNNADNRDPETDLSRNAVKFDYFIARQADQARRLFEQRGIAKWPAVLGIYVGWRGDSLTTPGLRKLTIGNRADTANRLASNRDQTTDLYPSLTDIAAALRKADPNGRLIVIGHSLGGRILSRLFLDDLARGNDQPLGKNSLLVALEPAIGADCFDRILGPKHTGKAGPPTFLSLTSRNDESVSWIYHAASFLIPDCDNSSSARGVTVGNYDAYLTHKLVYDGYHDTNVSSEELAASFPSSNSPNNWFEILGKNIVTYKMRDVRCTGAGVEDCYVPDAQVYAMKFQPLDNVSRAGPVWNVLSDASVVDLTNDPGTINAHHNGYISTNLTRALIELLYVRTP